MSLNLFDHPEPIIAALHLPDFTLKRHPSVAWHEGYALAIAWVFAEAGIPWFKLQNQAKTAGPAAPYSLALLAALGRLIRAELPQLGFGIIIEAHDPVAALSVAHAAGADFVRLNVFVGGALTARNLRNGLAAEAVALRVALRRTDIMLLADAYNHTAVPISGESHAFGANWAVKSDADGLIITGNSISDTLNRIGALRGKGICRPIQIGRGVTEANAADAMAADGVIVSSALMRSDAGPEDLLRWDVDLCRRFEDAARVPA